MASTSSALDWTTGAPGGSSPHGGVDFNGGFLTVPNLDVNTHLQSSDYTMALWLSADVIPGENFFLGQSSLGIHHGLRNEGKLHQAHWGADHSGQTTVPFGPADDATSWVHATFTWDSTQELGQIYFNGAPDHPEPVSKKAPNGDGHLIIGARNNGEAQFDGQLDDVAVWTRVLSQPDIAELANGKSPGAFDDGLLAYWDFEEGNGFVAGDRSSNGFDATTPLPCHHCHGFPLAPGNWDVRLIGIEGGADDQVNDHFEARNIIAFANGGPNLNGWELSVDVADNRNRIDLAGGGGSFAHNHVYPDGTNHPNGDGEDFVVHATTKHPFCFSAGDWTIAFGSDDGGQLQLEGVNFISTFNTDGDSDANDDTIFYNGNRGHAWTGGTFTVGPGGLLAHVDASMHERSGGDSFEIAAAKGHYDLFTESTTFRALAGEREHGQQSCTLGRVEGDFNFDGSLEVADLELLNREIRELTLAAHYDLNSDGNIDQLDRERWVKELAKTYFGDADLDGEFNSGDLVVLFTAGQYEDGINTNSTWSTGDFDGNGDFDSVDLALAFADGGYEQGPRAELNRVPEPNAIILFVLGWLGCMRAATPRPR